MRIRWRGLELPSQVTPERSTLSATYGKFVAEPFERGFGVTVGNSLRRILLSSLEGSAVTQIKLHGAQHEFTTLPGVVEDVTDIVLNVKSLVVKNHSEQTRVIRVEKNSRGPVTGADVRTDDQVEVINKDHCIATLTDDVPFLLEMVVENGRGYVPAGEHTPQAQEIGIIPVDAAFSPVVRVRYEVEETRVGHKTNYDKLTMEIWTNGSVTPEMALVESAKILRKHLNPFVQYQELGPMVHAEARALGNLGLDAAIGGQAEHEPGGVGPLGPRHQLPGIGKHHHRPRPRHPHRKPIAGSAQLRRDHAQRSPRETLRHRPAAGNAAAAGPAGVECGLAETNRLILKRHTTMRHRRKGRKLGRNPNHQRALLRNLASALILTERDATDDDNTPKVKGRIITTLQKAKEVRPLVERCITIARRALAAPGGRRRPGPDAERQSEKWRSWRHERALVGVEPGDGPRGGRPPPRCPSAGRQAGGAHPLQRHCPPLRRSPRRLHPRPPLGQAAAGRRRHAGHPRVGRASATASAAAPPGRRSRPRPPRSTEPSAEAAGEAPAEPAAETT